MKPLALENHPKKQKNPRKAGSKEGSDRMPAKKRHATLRKDGRWQCKVNGKTFIDRDIDEARRKADEYDAQLKLGIYMAQQPKTVRAYAAEWLPLHKQGVSDRHYDACAAHLDRLAAVCGDQLLSDVKPDDAARRDALLRPLARYDADHTVAALSACRGIQKKPPEEQKSLLQAALHAVQVRESEFALVLDWRVCGGDDPPPYTCQSIHPRNQKSFPPDFLNRPGRELPYPDAPIAQVIPGHGVLCLLEYVPEL